MNNELIIELMHPVIIAVITAVLAFVGRVTVILIKRAIAYAELCLDADTYDQAMDMAYGLHVYLEKKYNISGMGDIKRSEMQSMLLEKFPKLTQAELDSINEAVWEAFNMEWNKKEVVRLDEKV